jgi:hypothetical protein
MEWGTVHSTRIIAHANFRGSMKPRLRLTIYTLLATAVGLTGLLAMGLAVYGRHLLEQPSMTWGLDAIQAGDTRAVIPFDHRFTEEPLVTIGAADYEPYSATISNAWPRSLEVTIDQPLPRRTYFSWFAIETGATCSPIAREFLGHYQLRIRTSNLRGSARVTAWKTDSPTEITVQLDDAGADLAGTGLIRATTNEASRILAGRNGPYPITAINSLLRLVIDPFPECPRIPWQLDPDEWVMSRQDDKAVLSIADSEVRAPTWDEVVAQIAGVISTTNAFDIFQHNNQVLDFIDSVAGEIRTSGQTVIHFDAHSDFYVYERPQDYVSSEDIAEFMNTLIADGNASEVYWVVPDWTRRADYADVFWGEEFIRTDAGNPTSFLQGPASLDLWVDLNRKVIFFDAPAESDNVLRRIRFHKLTVDELPDFTDNESIYLEVDADYFSNTGYDTQESAGENPGEADLKTLLHRSFRLLADRNVRPALVSLSTSPFYTADEDRRMISHAFELAAERIGLKDRLIGYRHIYPNGISEHSLNVRREEPLHEFLYALRVLDHAQVFPDDRIVLRPDADDAVANAELRDAIAAADRIGIASPSELLERLASIDGINDGIIELIDVDRAISLGRAGALSSSGMAEDTARIQ